jgi:hypothetical protein
MSEYNPIIYLVSAIGAEIIKDIAKHLGKKSYEIAISLREPIIELGINDYNDYQEIQNKLEAKPSVKSDIETRVYDNREEFDEIMQILKNDSKLINFHSKGNEKVINIGTNHGPINM